MGKPKLLDLYCCAGGSGRGYADAGFDVYGVDKDRQRRYPFAFHQGDVLAVMALLLAGEKVAFTHRDGQVEMLGLEDFDAIHASPPCQFGSELTPAHARSRHLNLIPETRAMLQASGRPYVIENVRRVRAHLVNPVSLFGTMFDMHMVTSAGRRYVLARERLFETNWTLTAPADLGAQGHPIANVFGGHLRCRDAEHRTGNGTGRTKDFPGEDKPALARQLMAMPWASMGEMSEAVPPPFTECIGAQLMAWLQAQRLAA